VEQPQDIAGKLRRQGYRLTPQRVMILSVIENSENHISAEEIYSQVVARYPRVNISTVYRTLELLKQLGLIYEIDLGGGRIGYHPEGRGHHHHLICRECGAVIDVNESVLFPIQAILLQAFDFSADLRHLAIFGLCKDCRK
jgi:Fur family ferric uptake transcriptional regulator